MKDEEIHTGGSQGVVATLDELVALRAPAALLGEPPATRARHALAGPYRSAFRGGGIEFDEVRAYQPGDDVRGIDWRVTARTGRPHSRVFREERERPVWFGVDLAPAMHFGTRHAFKSVVAARAAALLGWSARDAGDRAGAVIRAAGATREHATTGSESRFFQILGDLARATEPSAPTAAAEGFDHALERLAGRVRPGSRVYVMSDFSELGESGRRALAELARQGDLTCLGVYDPLEQTPPPPGEYRVSNGREVLRIASGSRAFGDAWAEDFRLRWEALADFCQVHRAGLLALRTDDDLLEVLAAAETVARDPMNRRAA